jgi:ketosteroid isomerase-like protein
MAGDLTPAHGQSLLAAYKQAREARDPDAAMAMLSEDIECRFDPFEPPLRGHLEVRAYWNALVASQTEVEFDAENVWVVGRRCSATGSPAMTWRTSMCAAEPVAS